MLLSNNKEPRVKMFNDAVNVSYIYKAGKPNPANYKKAMEELGTDTGNTILSEIRFLRMYMVQSVPVSARSW